MKQSTFWQVWTNNLPVSFSKKEAFEALQRHWGLSRNPTFNRIRGGNFPNFVQDVSFMYKTFAIGFNMDQGFFYDPVKYEEIQTEEEKKEAELFQLVK